MTAEPTRRVMLAAAAAVALPLAGCKGLTALGPLPRTAADVVMLGHAITAEELMVGTYQAALAALASDAGATTVVAALLAEHRAHLAQLRSKLILPSRLATAKPGPSPTPPPMPAGKHQVLAVLVAAERAASVRLTKQLLDAPAPLAQLMASIGASEAMHVVILNRTGLAQ